MKNKSIDWIYLMIRFYIGFAGLPLWIGIIILKKSKSILLNYVGIISIFIGLTSIFLVTSYFIKNKKDYMIKTK